MTRLGGWLHVSPSKVSLFRGRVMGLVQVLQINVSVPHILPVILKPDVAFTG